MIGIYENAEQDIAKPSALLYKHWDSYPDENVPLLTEICTIFQERRGMNDTEYLAAWVMWWMVNKSVEARKETYKELKQKGSTIAEQYEEDGIDCLGYGVSQEFHADIEWYYRINPGEILVYKVNGWDVKPKEFVLTQTVKIEGEPKNGGGVLVQPKI